MEQLTFLFRELLSMGLLALPVMAVVMAARQLLRRAPKKYSFILWLAVGFRLVCPWQRESRLSLYNLPVLESVADTAAAVKPGVNEVMTSQTGMLAAIQENAVPRAIHVSGALRGALPEIAAVVWLIGLAVMLTWLLVRWLRLRRSVARAVRGDGRVWECDGLPTPFILGLVRPPHLHSLPAGGCPADLRSDP